MLFTFYFTYLYIHNLYHVIQYMFYILWLRAMCRSMEQNKYYYYYY
jgi:hypothetical protein